MIYSQKEQLEILKEVCLEMGLPWSDEPGETVIDGQPASEYFETHKIFENIYSEQSAVKNTLLFDIPEEYQAFTNDDPALLLNAA